MKEQFWRDATNEEWVLLVAEVKLSGKKIERINRRHYYSFTSIAQRWCVGRFLFRFWQ